MTTEKSSGSTYKRKLLKWKNGASPSGPYRSFQKRAWPSATDQQGNTAAHLDCDASYNASLAEDSGQYDITVRVADWTNDNNGRPDPTKSAFEWRRLTKTFKNVKDAKKAAEDILTKNPHFLKRV